LIISQLRPLPSESAALPIHVHQFTQYFSMLKRHNLAQLSNDRLPDPALRRAIVGVEVGKLRVENIANLALLAWKSASKLA
jgi:hypothetical protein